MDSYEQIELSIRREYEMGFIELESYMEALEPKTRIGRLLYIVDTQ